MKTQPGENRIVLRGEMAGPPRFSHESHGIRYDTFPLSVPRLSGTEDRLDLLVPRALRETVEPRPGDILEVEGQVRSYNDRSGQGRRLIISVLARTLAHGQGQPVNDLYLEGVLCKPPVLRRTPLGRDICDLLLAVNRRYGRADYLPCIAWGSLAVACGELPVGRRVTLEGRLQSRVYQKEENGLTVPHTAYEVSAMTMSLDGTGSPPA